MDSKFLILFFLNCLIQSALPQRCPNRWLLRPDSDSCYRFWPNVTATWTEAEEICSNYECTLLKLDSQAEKDWIINQVDKYPSDYEWWLGLQRHGQDDAKWPWTNGSGRNETNKLIDDEIWNNFLNAKICREPLQFICERPAAAVTNLGLTSGGIVGIVIGCLVVLVLISFLLIYLKRSGVAFPLSYLKRSGVVHDPLINANNGGDSVGFDNAGCITQNEYIGIDSTA